MGAYVNPAEISKETWLNLYADITEITSWNNIPKSKMLICLFDNGMFTAAGIAYSENEFDFINNAIKRNAKEFPNWIVINWYICDIDKLLQVSSELADYKIHYEKWKTDEN